MGKKISNRWDQEAVSGMTNLKHALQTWTKVGLLILAPSVLRGDLPYGPGNLPKGQTIKQGERKSSSTNRNSDQECFIVESSYNFSGGLKENQLDRQRFARDFLGEQNLKPGMAIEKGRELGRGYFGIVYASKDEHQIVKQGIGPQGSQNMQDELKNSNALVANAAQKLGQDRVEYGLLSGLGVIVTVIGKAKDGSLIQEKIQGKDLKAVVLASEHQAPYDYLGYPDNLQKAIARAASLFAGFIALHTLGMIHGDIKPDNIMLLYDAFADYPCRIIDLGIMTKIGDKIERYCSNGAPEYVELQRTIAKNESKIENLTEGYDALQTLLTQIPAQNLEELKDVKDTLEEFSKQITELRDSNKEQSTKFPTAQTSYDIYSSGSVLPVILFGRIGWELVESLYFPDTESAVSQYVIDARATKFNAFRYFLTKFLVLNEKMQKETG
ncbi:MAG: hypothetical protein LBB11_01450, partial [Puniceicoccales bacterium]|nr:hypothetical protein [Puniceicoccales bacterium]